MANSGHGLAILVECRYCSKKFEVSSGNEVVQHKKEFKANEQSIFLTYYDCPECGRRHFVQIDDKYSLDELKEVQRQFVKLSVLRTKDKNIPKKQSAKFKKAQQNLSDYRNGLMKQYTGATLTNHETGEEFTLQFSV